ncbi:hypothetical protein [Sulfurimonas microaerophilic]|uniref:hypothetical protein n=1 Tax=Sulfurimonas microaerophilic TaxID=3058392 RepID=UPI002714FA52|nr:hypothetical protein [Sulfurimonas sp. hsl 1-7]
MAGVHFSFDNFKQLVELNIGIADRLDENRAERFTILYCDFSSIESEVVNSSLATVLRTSDSVVNKDGDYYFVLPYTDQYGAVSVREIFEEFFDTSVASTTVSYPADGENVEELLESLKENGKNRLKKDLQLP